MEENRRRSRGRERRSRCLRDIARLPETGGKDPAFASDERSYRLLHFGMTIEAEDGVRFSAKDFFKTIFHISLRSACVRPKSRRAQPV